MQLLNEPGMTQHKLAEKLGVGRGLIAHAIRREKERQENKQDLNSEIRGQLLKGATRDELCQKFSISERILEAAISELSDNGFLIEQQGEILTLCRQPMEPDHNAHDAKWKGEQVIRFGLCGDNQINSKYTQLTYAHQLYDIYRQEGIKVVYHTGDLDEGEQMRPGHVYECYTQGADDHVKEIIKNYPRRDGIKTYFITGNHDHSLIKRAGYDIGHAIAQKREDMIYLGQSWATVNLTPNCILELRHPGDGTAYALSYKMQKMVDAMAGGEKPNILAVGHYHKVEYLFYRNIHIYQTGCLQAQTPWMKGKQIAAMLGGWIVEARVDSEGTITRIKHEFIPFYYGIPEDYKNWQQ